MNKTWQHTKPTYWILILLIFSFILFFGSLSFLRHDNFRSRRLDLGNMDQTVWNVWHGNGFTLTDPNGILQQSRLAVHADFLLIFLAPLYGLWSDPKMLLLVQVLVAAAGAIPVYFIAYDVLASRKLGLLFSFLYLWYPPLGRILLHDFHAVALSTTFLLYAFWFIEKKKYVLFLIFALFAAIGKEQAWITIAMLGIYLAFWKKQYGIGISTAALSLSMFFYLFWIAIPSVTVSNQHFALSYLSQYGHTLNEVLIYIITHPLEIMGTMLQSDKLYYYIQLFAPFGFLSLLSPLYLIFALEGFVINTLSSNALMRSIDYQYTSLMTPFIAVSAIYGFSRLQNYYSKEHSINRNSIDNGFVGIFILVFLFSNYFWGEFPVGKSQWFWHFITPVSERQRMKTISESIDSKYSVSVTNNIGAHFTQREFVYNFPLYFDKSDYSVIYLGDTYAWPSGREQIKAVQDLLKNPSYVLIAQEGNFFAFKKRSL